MTSPSSSESSDSLPLAKDAIPQLCRTPCSTAYDEARRVNLQTHLCSGSASNFKSLYQTCKICTTQHGSGDVREQNRAARALYEVFGEYVNYCELVESGVPISVGDGEARVVTRTAGGTTLELVTATFTVATRRVGAVEETGGVAVEGGGVDGGAGAAAGRVNTGVIVGAVVGAAIAVIIAGVVGVLFLRGRYKRRVKAALEGVRGEGRSGSSSGGSSTTIGNDVGVVGIDKKEILIAELDGTPVVKRAEMDVEGGYKEMDGEDRYKELDVECGYGELDVTKKRLSEGGVKDGVNEGEVRQENSKKEKDIGEVGEGVDAVHGGLTEKEERIHKEVDVTTAKSEGETVDIGQVQKLNE